MSGLVFVDTPQALNIYMASDFAVTEPRGAESDPDYTEHGVFGLGGDGDVFVLDWWCGQATADVWIDSMLDLQEKHQPLAWFGEGGVIRRAVEPFLLQRARARRVFCRYEWIQPIHDKATRGRSFQAMASMGKIVFPHPSPWASRVIDQCVAFPGGKHDDAFDVLSLFCRALDQAHPAIVYTDKQDKPRDRWARKAHDGADSWRVV